jgi:hypothetical protein
VIGCESDQVLQLSCQSDVAVKAERVGNVQMHDP